MITRYDLATGPMWVNTDSRTSIRFGEWSPAELRQIADEAETITKGTHEVTNTQHPGGDRTPVKPPGPRPGTNSHQL